MKGDGAYKGLTFTTEEAAAVAYDKFVRVRSSQTTRLHFTIVPFCAQVREHNLHRGPNPRPLNFPSGLQ